MVSILKRDNGNSLTIEGGLNISSTLLILLPCNLPLIYVPHIYKVGLLSFSTTLAPWFIVFPLNITLIILKYVTNVIVGIHNRYVY